MFKKYRRCFPKYRRNHKTHKTKEAALKYKQLLFWKNQMEEIGMKMKKRKRLLSIQAVCVVVILAVVLLFGLGRRKLGSDTEYFSEKQVAVFEVISELDFGVYGQEDWDSFFSAYGNDCLTGEMLERLLVQLGVSEYIQVQQMTGGSIVSREEWNQVYLQILDYLDTEKSVSEVEFLVMDVMEAKDQNIIVTNQGDYYTTLPVSYFEQWQTYQIHAAENVCLGIYGFSANEQEIANAYLKSFENKTADFLYQGSEYRKEIGSINGELTAGVYDFVFAEGRLQTLRSKQDRISGTLLSYDESEIEIEHYGRLAHQGKIPVYQTYGEVAEKSISDVVLGNMEVEYITGENQVCAILLNRPANIENIRVLLLAEDGGKFRADSYVRCSEQTSLTCGERKETIPAGGVVHVTDYLPQDAADLPGDTLVLVPEDQEGMVYVCDPNGNVTSNGYYGTMELRRYAEGYTLVNQLPIETYLCAVVPSEMPSSYAAEALRAQAVCARSYAYIQLFRADLMQYGAHINDSTSYQVYNKVAPTEESKAAVYDTAGKVMTYQGEVIEAYYFSTSMGYTDTAEVWNVEDVGTYGYLKRACLNTSPDQGVLSDETAFYNYITQPASGYDSDIKFYRWSATASYREKTGEINQILDKRRAVSARNILYYEKDGVTERDSLEGIESLTELTVTERSASGAILTLKLQYENGMVLVKSEYNIRSVLGCGAAAITYQDGSINREVTLLPSAFCTVERQSDGTYVLHGGGYGHGLGMSQNAANGMAKAGMSYEEILKYFYQDINLSTM